MPPATVSAIKAKRPLFAGVDVGGTGIKLGIVDDDGLSLGKSRIDTQEERGPADAMSRAHTALHQQLKQWGVAWEDVVAVGLGTPGTMDVPRGMILAPPNLPHWRYFPVRDELSRLCQRPVAFVNDANAAGYGEFWVGSGKDVQNMIMLTLGTGVGGGIIVDGRLVEGANSFGSECGHVIIDSRDDARLCVWGGGRGQLEAYASASAVTERTIELLDQGRASTLQRRRQSQDVSPLMVGEEANAGDELALEILAETARYLGIGIVTLVHTVDPGLVVLGGAMNFGGEASRAGQYFIERVRSEFRKRAFDVVANTTTIAYASLGGDAGYIGAAGIARQAWHKSQGRYV